MNTRTPSAKSRYPWTVQVSNHGTSIWIGIRRAKYGGNGEGSILAQRFISRRTAVLHFSTVERLIARTQARFEKKAARQNAKERFVNDTYAALAALAAA